jgi:pectate lyase/pectin methylesterase-like acyl-CoA thioesterase
MFSSRFLSVGLVAFLVGSLCPIVSAQTKAFNDTFTGGSTINANPASPAAPTVTAASYQQVAAKTFNPNPPAITSGNLRFGIVSTTSGFNHLQALFTQYPVTLGTTGNYLELTVNFSTEGGIITAQTNSTLFFGLYNAGQVQPIPGGMNGTAATATPGFAQTWQGYANRIFFTGGNNGFFTRPSQTAAAANNQDVLFQYASGAGVGSTATSTLAAFTSGAQFTEVYRITRASATTLTLSSSLYAGTTATGVPLYTQTVTSSSVLTAVFDAFAIGWRATGSLASVMNISAVKITTTGTTTIVPEITTQPFSLTKAVGESVTLAVVADGGNGTALSYQWKKGGFDLPGETSANFSIPSVALADAGDYTVVVTDVAGSTTSQVATLTVTAGAVAPSITVDPVGATILVSGSHTFTGTANGTAPLSYQWQKSTDGGANYVDVPGATTSSYMVSSAVLADAGLYRLVVTNGQGSAASAAAELVIMQAPVINSQPTGGTLNVGDSITLSVGASGTPAPTYQWKRNGVNLPGATSASYLISSASGANAGNYTVVVTNSVSSVTSATAAVAVLSSSMAASSTAPLSAATGLNPDTRLTITFNEPVTPGISGLLRIYDAATDAVVDTIDLVAATALRDALRASSAISTQLLPVQTKPIGGIPNNFNYYPITVSGNAATIYPRNGVLTYGKTYYVKIEPGVFLNAAGESFGGIADNTTWRFSTKASGPAAGTTNLLVAADGSGDFNTLQAALDFVPANNTVPTTIRLKNGAYFEEVGFQSKHFITILGEDPVQTILGYPNNNTFNNVSGVYHRSVLVAQSVHDFTVANLTIFNTTPQNGSQAEAIVINGSSATTAHNVVTGCNFYSYQDTVQFNKQTYVSDCAIVGDVDFMWGDGPVFFENCDIRILRTAGFFTQVRNGNGNHGFVFHNCRFTAPAGISGTFFGRIDPTAGGFPFSEVVVLDSTVGDATNNTLLGTATGVSGSNYLAAWWLLNNAASAAAAPNVHNWSNGLLDSTGAALVNPNADAFTTMPLDPTTQANYRNATWVLNTNLAGTVLGSWTPSLAPLIVAQPLSQTVVAGQPAVFTVEAIGVPQVTYQWQKDGVDLPGATAATLTIPSAGASDIGVYRVLLTNSAGTVPSSEATLDVNGIIVAPTIATPPADLSVQVGQTATFNVVASGTGPFTYQWKKNGFDIAGATAAIYQIPSAAFIDAGSYSVVVSNSAGSAPSSAAILTVTAVGGGALVNDVLADGNSSNQDLANNSLRIFNGRAAHTRTDAVGSVAFAITTTGADAFWAHFTDSGAPLSLAVGDRLTVEVTFSVSGFAGTGQDIRFGVLNSAGSRNTANLAAGMNSSVFADDLGYAVRYVASTSATPFTLLKRNPVGSTANPNNPFNSTAATDWTPVTSASAGTTTVASLVNGTSYTLAYEIFRETETNTVVSTLVTGGSLPAAYGQIATDTSTTLTSFDYFAFRIPGSAFSSGVTLTQFEVLVERSTPAIVAQPTFTGGANTLSLPVSGSTVLSVGATGAGLSYQWLKNGALIPGATSSSLTFFNVQPSDAGSYTVFISNAGGGVASAPATLTVTGGPVAPIITTPPASQTVAEGAPTTFSVVAIGTTPFSYQWYKGAAPIPGATSASFAIANTLMSDAGDYSVVVSNVAGDAPSAAATLTVKGVASIEKSGFAGGVTGGAAGLTVTVANAADLKFYAESITPYTIVVAGTIDLGVNGRIKPKSNHTIKGATTSSTILGSLDISNADNVIVSNLNISADTGPAATNDGVTIASSTNVLVTKCTIYNCTDGNLDVINGSDLVTVSWCKFYYTRDNGHNFSNLVGSSDTDVGSGNGLTNYRITWHHNWWSTGAKQRMIACRFGSSHMFNNLWDCAGDDYCTETRNIAAIFSEYNYYHNVSNPLGKRTALPNDVGLLMTIGNVFDACSGSQLVSSDLVFAPPYSYGINPAASVPALVMAGAGNVTENSPVVSSATISGSVPLPTAGGAITLTAVPAGFTPTSYQWRFNNVAIPGATAATLDFANVQLANAGNYTVVLGVDATNAVVSAPYALAVRVPEAPTITTQPLSQSVTVGDPVSFTVAASGDAPFSYQWYRDGSPIGGATGATLQLLGVTTANAGGYHAVVTNLAGSVPSNIATLTVEKAVASVSVENATVTFDGSAKTATVTTAPAGLSVVITYNGSADAPVNAGNYAVAATIVDADYTGSGSGTLAIAPAPATVTLGNLAQTYNGTPRFATATTSPAGLPVTFTYNGSATAPTNAGSYAVIATIAQPNYTGSASGTLTVAKASAAIVLAPLSQNYDGTVKTVTATTAPAGLAVNLLYDGGLTGPIYPGEHSIAATIDDANYTGAATDTLVITITALVRHAPTLNGDLDGSLQVLLPENVAVNGPAMISGDLLEPGSPELRLNGHPTFVGAREAFGAAAPMSHTVTLNGDAVLRYLVRRVDPIALPLVTPPPAPLGTRTVTLNTPSQTAGDFATLRNLTLNSGAGQLPVPPGTYGAFTAKAGTSLVLGIPGATEPAIYNLQNLVLANNAQLLVVGPVVLTLANGTALFNGTVLDGVAGDAAHPQWLVLNLATGGISLGSNATVHGFVNVPAGTVIIPSGATLHGRVTSDRLTINRNGLLDDGTP